MSDREQRAWRGFLRANSLVAARLRRQLQADSGLSTSDYEVLVHLSEAPEGRVRAFGLGATLQWEKSRLSHHLRRMEQRGLVVRRECPSDARGAFVVLTDAGRHAIEAAAPLHVEEVRRCFVDGLTSRQLDDLAEVTSTIVRHLQDQEAGELAEEGAEAE